MIAIILIGVLFALFYFARRKQSSAVLAAIAGLAIFNLTATDVVSFISSQLGDKIPGYTSAICTSIFATLLILFFPLIVYFRSDKLGTSKFHLIQSLIFAAMLSALLLPYATAFIALDSISAQVNGFLQPALIYLLIANVVLAYFDILFRKAAAE